MDAPESNQNTNDEVVDLAYEEAFRELETIISVLEIEERSLEETLALFARGQALARRCAELLDQAELKVQQLSGDSLADLPD